MKPLVSLITPCYNVEKKISIYLDSILKQTYDNIELILVNDGSVDATQQIITKYIPLLERKGISVQYFNKENGGAASAVKMGLNYVNGKYIMWPDADDFLTENAIESKVKFLEDNPQYAMVRSNAYCVPASNLQDLSKLAVKSKNLKRHNIYKEIIYFKTFFVCGCYMVRWSDFLKANPDKYIYQTYYGQNIQMLVPLAYNFKCGFIDEAQYGYIIYNDSHSHLGGKKTYEKRIDYLLNMEKIMVNTLKHMNCVPKSDFEKIKYDFCCRRMKISYNAGYRENVKKEYKKLNFIRKISIDNILMIMFKKNKLTDFVIRLKELSDIAIFQLANRR